MCFQGVMAELIFSPTKFPMTSLHFLSDLTHTHTHTISLSLENDPTSRPALGSEREYWRAILRGVGSQILGLRFDVFFS